MTEFNTEEDGKRLDELRRADERQTAHSDEGKRLGHEQECQHVGKWQAYCGSNRNHGARLGRGRA